MVLLGTRQLRRNIWTTGSYFNQEVDVSVGAVLLTQCYMFEETLVIMIDGRIWSDMTDSSMKTFYLISKSHKMPLTTAKAGFYLTFVELCSAKYLVLG